MVDERRKRIPQALLWALAGAALAGVFVFVVAVAPSLFIRHPYSGLKAVDELKARNDVRTTLVQALAGLAVAGGLVVTYRTYRQNRAEQDRTYERELYAKAVEQLGHEKAPVRLGALYSLERLAEDKPERRQIIVDVICAYLRMPFSPTAPGIKPESETIEAREVPAAETERRIEGTSDTWQQERQVRLTAQRILCEHLRDDRPEDKRSTDPPGSRFWPNMHLDLVGATLIDFYLKDGVLADANFRGATFRGETSFDGATFSGEASFDRATFSDTVSFDKATFCSDASFWTTFSGRAQVREATFSGKAWFKKAIFSGITRFDSATFSGSDAWFEGATFSRGTLFRDTTFNCPATFDDATFSDAAGFINARFCDSAGFERVNFCIDITFFGATFSRSAVFARATFNDASFDWATFRGITVFDKTTFSGTATFDKATFSTVLSFKGSRVLSPDAKHDWPTGRCLGPDGSGGYTVVRAEV
jgi:uncharacterized protein YjbI with pentapeptide repeats